VAGEAAIYVDPFSVEEICQAMIRIEKDASLRNELAQKGLDRSRLFSWDDSADKVWEVLRRLKD
jgi:glycosyltransferase involved in cell wall biosynthesis